MGPCLSSFFSRIVPLRLAALLAAAPFLPAGPTAAQAPTWQWGLQSLNPTPTDDSPARGNAVATDAAGRVYVGGEFGNLFSSSGTAIRNFGGASIGPNRGGFVAQATAAGQWAWATTVTTTGGGPSSNFTATVSDVAVTATGEVYAAGSAYGTNIQVGGQTQPLSNGSGASAFVARFDNAGVCQWLRVVGGSFTTPAVAADPSTGGVVLAGFYSGSASFGSISLPLSGGPGTYALFAARLGATGQWLGAAAATGLGGSASAVNVAVGPTGQVAVASSQRAGTLSFGATTLSVPSGTTRSFVVAQLGGNNQWQWAVGGAGSDNSTAFDAGYTPTGALWVSGVGTNGTVVGPATLLAPTPPGATSPSFAGYVGQLSSAGQWGTVRQLSASGSGRATFGPLAVDGVGNALVLGGLVGYSGTVQATLGSQVLASPGTGLLLFVASLNSAGQWRYVATVPQSALASGFNPTATALDGSGSLYLTGGLRGGLTLGSSVLTGSYDPVSPFPRFGDVVLGKLINANALTARPGTAAPALACFPNPARTAATLRLPASTPEPRTTTLADALGREVRRLPVPARATSAILDLAGLTPGLYVVRCGAAAGRLMVE